MVIGAISNWPLGLHPDPRSGARYNLGLALREAGRFDEALRELERARELWPGSPDVHIQMGHARFARGDFDAARADFVEAARLAPDRADARVGLGMVYMAQGDASRASDAYRTALALDPSHVEAHNNQASLLARQGRWAEAVVHFRSAAEASGDHAEILVNLGTAELQTGESQAALDAYRRALALEPGLGSARYGAGLALEALGRGGAAAGIFALLVRDPAANESTFQGDAITRLADYRATCREPEIRDPDEALRLAASARRLGPEFESMQALAAARAASGDFDGALRAADAALRLSERSPVAPEFLESARRRRAAYLDGRAVFQDCPF
jgi:tetratricopeptide (TPR) repeat protein